MQILSESILGLCGLQEGGVCCIVLALGPVLACSIGDLSSQGTKRTLRGLTHPLPLFSSGK